jgi:hypothetical protein
MRTLLNKITTEEMFIAKQILSKVFDAMEYDEELSDGKGHLNSEAIFTDGGRFTLAMNREQFEILNDLINKI